MTLQLDEQIETIRQREAAEGNLFDCPHKYHAVPIIIENQKRCAGYRMGVGGRGLSPNCPSCDNYAQTPSSATPTLSMVEAAERMACQHIPGMDYRVTLSAAAELRMIYEASQRVYPKISH